MDEQKFTAISHIDLDFCVPVSAEKVDHVIDRIPMEPGTRVLDVGCSKAEMLIRAAEICQIQAIGIDSSPYYIQAAHEALAARAPGADIELYETTFDQHEVEPNSFDVIICVGSTGIFGGYEGALQALKPLLIPGGFLLIGARYWRQAPTDEILLAFGDSAHGLYDYAGTIQVGASEGYIPRYVAVSSVDDWDHYRWSHFNAIEQYALEHDDDLSNNAMLQKSRMIRDRYLAWERDVMGFGMYLFSKGGA